MLTENHIVDAVAGYLASRGYRIDRKLTTSERGPDIEATHLESGMRMFIEAKGGTSSKPASKRFGKPFSSNQANHHVSVAFYCAAMLRQRHLGKKARIALAFPDDANHRHRVKEIESALALLGITVFFVDANLRVQPFEDEKGWETISSTSTGEDQVFGGSAGLRRPLKQI